jgi:ABC-type multidrug transport system ATPase subunit
MAEASWPRRNQPVDDFACRRDKDKAHKKRIALDLEFRDLAVFGRANVSNIQETVFSVLEIPFRRLFGITRKKPETQIIHSMDGLIKSGELVAIIGKPASGCSTLLKALAGQLHGLRLGGKTKIEFGGISQVRMMHHFGGEINYLPEIDMHFPYLSVNQTLHFAAALRAPYDQLQGRSRNEYANQAVEKALETYNLKQTISTRVGNEFIRGVSGGERRRVSIAEMALSNCVVSCWDQSTKGLDSSSALAFIKSLRELALNGSIHIVTIYQASDQVLRQFDKVIVLYEGRQVYFGSAMEATVYFEEMGWQKPRNQPIGDFLAAVTNPEERKCREGYEHRIPSTAEEFEQTWKSSPLYLQLLKSLDEYESKASEKIGLSSELEQVLSPKLSPTALGTVRKWSTCVANVHEQVRYCSLRMIQRLWNEKMTTIATNTALLVMALILGTLFFQTKDTTDGLYSKAAVLFSALLLNAMVTVTEIFQTQGNKPIIEKQVSYRFYRPAVEAWSSILLSIPLKFITATVFNIVLYFLSGLRKTPGAFFTLFLFVYVAIFVMSAVFKTIAAGADSTAQAFVFVGVILPLFIVYTGFVVPEPYMKPWFKWLIYINPVKL